MQFSCLLETQHFDAKKLQGVWLGIQYTTGSQILSLKMLKCIRTWIKTFTTTRFWIERIKTCKILRKKFVFNKARFELCYSLKTKFFAISMVVQNQWSRIEIFTMRHIRNSKSTKTEIACLKNLQSVRISTETFEAFPTFSQKIKRGRNLKKSVHSKNHVLNYVAPSKNHILHFSSLLEKNDFEMVNSDFKKLYNLSDFELKNLQWLGLGIR